MGVRAYGRMWVCTCACVRTVRTATNPFQSVPRSLCVFVQRVLYNLPSLLLHYIPYIVVVLIFVAFVFINGSIVVGLFFSRVFLLVFFFSRFLLLYKFSSFSPPRKYKYSSFSIGVWCVGDKSNHTAMFHAPQLLYFCAFATVSLGLHTSKLVS